jgi:aspartate racemase
VAHPRSLGVVGGLGALAGADVFMKLIRASLAAGPRDIVFEQHPFDEPSEAGAGVSPQHARKLYVFETLRGFERRGIEVAVLPCFISHTFLDEIAPETRIAVVDMLAGLRTHVARRHPEASRIGVLTSDYVRSRALFERYFAPPYALVYPSDEAQAALMHAIYGPGGIKSGRLDRAAIALLDQALRDLAARGAEVILPGFTEIPVALDAVTARDVPIVDCNQVCAQHALDYAAGAPPRPFKIGVIGGVGPAATVDFMDKVVRATGARRDQDHVKMVVEHNPQIPDRTEHLVGAGPDPTVALYAAAKKLEAADADLIAIPCNTAHAFVERIQPYLAIPIVNMLHETVRHVRSAHGPGITAGLLATDGTVASAVYHDAAAGAGLRLITPDAAHQALVMEAIYGERGVKAGYTTGACRDALLAALAHLAARGALVVILGCTELPLILPGNPALAVGDRTLAVLDPTEILARACVTHARSGARA